MWYNRENMIFRHDTDRKESRMAQSTRTPTSRSRTQTGARKSPQRRNNRKKPAFKLNFAWLKDPKKRLIAIICAGIVVLALLVGLIVGLVSLFTRDNSDDLILENVVAGGVDLGGLTKEEAKRALHSVANDFSTKDMTIKLPDATIVLSPAQTGAKLNVDAVVEAAYQYGRTGTEEENEQTRRNAKHSIHTIALLHYLNMDLPYIEQYLEEFCASYSTQLTQPTVKMNGAWEEYDPEDPTKPRKFPTLTITMGTPNYVLDPTLLYARVLDAYSLNHLAITYQAPVLTAPNKLNAASIFAQYCREATDAVQDEITYDVTPEIYGYGFDVAALQSWIDTAAYGATKTITLEDIFPLITEATLTEGQFSAICGTHTTSSNKGTNWNNNMNLACQAINNYVIGPGKSFSFNAVVGRPSDKRGYKNAPGYQNGKDGNVMGAGISQVASTLYCSALKAELQIEERHCSLYAPDYIQKGLDAYVNWGFEDLVITNNTASPIRILATALDGTVTIELWGVDERDYYIDLETNTVAQTNFTTSYSIMDRNNIHGYADGHVLQAGIVGYRVETFAAKFDKFSDIMTSKGQISVSDYSSRKQILVRLDSHLPTQPTVPSTPTTPTTPIDPTLPTDPVIPQDPAA